MSLLDELWENNLFDGNPDGAGKHLKAILKGIDSFTDTQKQQLLDLHMIPFAVSVITGNEDDGQVYLCVLGSDMVVHEIDNTWPTFDLVKLNLERNIWFIQRSFVALTGHNVSEILIFNVPTNASRTLFPQLTVI